MRKVWRLLGATRARHHGVCEAAGDAAAVAVRWACWQPWSVVKPPEVLLAACSAPSRGTLVEVFCSTVLATSTASLRSASNTMKFVRWRCKRLHVVGGLQDCRVMARVEGSRRTLDIQVGSARTRRRKRLQRSRASSGSAPAGSGGYPKSPPSSSSTISFGKLTAHTCIFSSHYWYMYWPEPSESCTARRHPCNGGNKHQEAPVVRANDSDMRRLDLI